MNRRFLTNPKKVLRTLKTLLRALFDKRTPWAPKILFVVAIGYLVLPIDIVPEFIPLAGWIDDLIITPTLLYWVTKLIPRDIIQQERMKQKHKQMLPPHHKWSWQKHSWHSHKPRS